MTKKISDDKLEKMSGGTQPEDLDNTGGSGGGSPTSPIGGKGSRGEEEKT